MNKNKKTNGLYVYNQQRKLGKQISKEFEAIQKKYNGTFEIQAHVGCYDNTVSEGLYYVVPTNFEGVGPDKLSVEVERIIDLPQDE